eukprot:CAMPEP_0202868052 /NCGR_PEP_ID=MMETSP1391-20130828/10068_1 /ASSEMBLY_ACC=CAM_ASM_000867 /TAXON_ID=1034604 /ORGANISM="Chlamydomonas leiostraca, Strain SAG 11-49" /LENGTH=139 /DNA_ID=CAMNT_0049548153 /DNA_START=16 /DNA_END=435 /DNA_ORIENTATION=-
MDQPASVQRVQKAIEGMVEDLQRTYLIPKQKDAFLCCAKCCDTSSNAPELQTCIERCSMSTQQQQKTIQAVMQDFQERFQRCALRCQDAAREVAGFDPSPSDEAKAKDKFNSCMDVCGKEFEGKVPKLKSDIIAQLKKM